MAHIACTADRPLKEVAGQGPDRVRCRVVIADDHPLVRKALVDAAHLSCPDAIIDDVETLAALMDVLAADGDVGLVLLDLNLRDAQGFGGLRAVRARFPCIPVAIISAQEDDHTIGGALDLGAMGFIPKSAHLRQLTDAIATIYAGEVWTPGTAAGAARSSEQPGAALTPAQRRIVSGLQRGLLNKQIAYELGVTEHTVKAHMTAAFRKLGVANRMQAMVVLGTVSVY